MKIPSGTIVYFREANLLPRGKQHLTKFSGHGYGILLGEVPLFKQEPPLEIILSQMGGIGFVNINDVEEFLGKEASQLFVKKWTEKYLNKVKDLLFKKGIKDLPDVSLKLATPPPQEEAQGSLVCTVCGHIHEEKTICPQNL